MPFGGGDKTSAKRHFAKAATSTSDVGLNAAIALAKLDLPANPGAYIKTALGITSTGHVAVTLQNQSAVMVSDLHITILLFSRSGKTQQKEKIIFKGPLKPGGTKTVTTRLTPGTSGYGKGGIQTNITAVTIVD